MNQAGSAASGPPWVMRTRRGQWIGKRWCRVTTGVRCRSEPDVDPFVAQLLAWQEVLPADARWTHLTAARILGWWLPPAPRSMPVFAAHSGSRRIRREGLVSIRRDDAGPWMRIGQLRVDPASEIIASCARTLSELDLACVVAAALQARACTIDELTRHAATPRGGMRALRRVLERTDHRHESIWEVLLAELHRAVGVAVVPQKEIVTAAGDFVARGDLWLVGTQRLHEYDGAHHAEPGQRRNDLRREGRILRAGWSRRGYVKDDVLHGAVQVLADAHHALGRAEEPGLIRAWHEQLRCSLFSPAGMAAFARRLGL